MLQKHGCSIAILLPVGFIGLMLFTPGIIFPAGGSIEQKDIARSIQRRTKGCTAGGTNPKGFGYSEFPDAYRVWYEIDISGQELECMKSKKVITILPKDQAQTLVGIKSRMGKPPEWFKPKELIGTLDEKSSLLTTGDGQKERYFVTSGDND